MKNVKLISLSIAMLICFVMTAQEKAVNIENKPVVKMPSNFPQADTTKNLRIICMKSVSNKGEPLYILDGFPVKARQIAKINPYDIESIKVLKGIEATSVYGNQALNGVVVFATKEKTQKK